MIDTSYLRHLRRIYLPHLRYAALLLVFGLGSPAHAGAVAEWITKFARSTRLGIATLAMRNNPGSTNAELKPRDLTLGRVRAALCAQGFAQSSAGLCSASKIPTDLPGLQKMFTRFLRLTDASSREVVKYDVERIAILVSPKILKKVDARIADLTVHQLMAGEQVEIRGDDYRGKRDHETRSGGNLIFRVGPDGVETSSDRYLRGKRVVRSLKVSPALPGESLGDLRDWVLVHRSKGSSFGNQKHRYSIFCSAPMPDSQGGRQQACVMLDGKEYEDLLAARLEPGSFASKAGKMNLVQRIDSALTDSAKRR